MTDQDARSALYNVYSQILKKIETGKGSDEDKQTKVETLIKDLGDALKSDLSDVDELGKKVDEAADKAGVDKDDIKKDDLTALKIKGLAKFFKNVFDAVKNPKKWWKGLKPPQKAIVVGAGGAGLGTIFWMFFL